MWEKIPHSFKNYFIEVTAYKFFTSCDRMSSLTLHIVVVLYRVMTFLIAGMNIISLPSKFSQLYLTQDLKYYFQKLSSLYFVIVFNETYRTIILQNSVWW